MNYREEVLRNCPGFATDSMEKKLSLAGLGIAGEAGEVVDVVSNVIHYKVPPLEVSRKAVLEIGDTRWYLEYLAATLDLPEPFTCECQVTSIGMGLSAMGLARKAGAVADHIKKVLHHGAHLDTDKLIKAMNGVDFYLECLTQDFGSTTAAVLDANVAKLRARHPQGWTPESQRAKVDERGTV